MYSFDSRVRYSECDFSNRLSVSSIVNYFQDCSNFQSEAEGVGVQFLKEHHSVWLLTSWQVEINRRPSNAEKIKISTWPYEFKGMFGGRNFLMQDEAGEPVAYANSVWVYFDTDAQRPLRAPETFAEIYGVEPRYEMTYLDRKLRMPTEYTEKPAIKVTRDNLDTNMHVNNVQHIRLAENYLPLDYEVSGVRVDYRLQAFWEDTIIPLVSETEEGITVALCNTEKKPYSIVSFRERS